MPVAKSYQCLKIIKEPYLVNGKMYVQVEKNGTAKQVRWYSDKEYEKLYGEKPAGTDNSIQKTQKDILGFEKGYITIFTGEDTYTAKDWFKEHGARYTRFWGWYIISTMEVPEDLPEGIQAIKLDWDVVGTNEGVLKPDDQVQQAIDNLIYSDSSSQFMGTIGERLEKVLTVTKAIPFDSRFGLNTMHIMEDADGNVYVWTTGSKSWEVGSVHNLRGTVKDHKTYKNVNQTILTRCMEVKK